MNSRPLLLQGIIAIGCLSTTAAVTKNGEDRSGRLQVALPSAEQPNASGTNSCIQLPLPFGPDITKAKITSKDFKVDFQKSASVTNVDTCEALRKALQRVNTLLSNDELNTISFQGSNLIIEQKVSVTAVIKGLPKPATVDLHIEMKSENAIDIANRLKKTRNLRVAWSKDKDASSENNQAKIFDALSKQNKLESRHLSKMRFSGILRRAVCERIKITITANGQIERRFCWVTMNRETAQDIVDKIKVTKFTVNLVSNPDTESQPARQALRNKIESLNLDITQQDKAKLTFQGVLSLKPKTIELFATVGNDVKHKELIVRMIPRP